MWVSKEQMESLERRIDWLEKNRVETAETKFTVYKNVGSHLYLYGYETIPKSTISVKTVIERILEKLGMELTYVAGQPEKVEMQKKAKP